MPTQLPHLQVRDGVYYYRRRVPREIVPAIGKSIIQFSLGTSDKKKAVQLKAIHDVEWNARFAAAGKAKGDLKGGLAPVSSSQIIQIVQKYVREADKRRSDSLLNSPPETAQEQRDIRDEADLELSIMKSLDDPRSHEQIHFAEKRLLAGQEVGPAVWELLRRALIEIASRHAARAYGDHSGGYFNKLFDPNAVIVPTFSDVARQYLEMVATDAKANCVSAKWVEKQVSNVDTLVEMLGSTLPVTGVDFDLCERVRRTLAGTPAHRKKLYPGLSLQEAISAAMAAGAPSISSTTQKQYLDTFRNVLGLAVRKGLLPNNPAAEIEPLKRDAVPASQKRKPFTFTQLKALFEGGYYAECGKLDQPYRADKDGWRFWLPLLCLFMGLRPNEGCQMLASDVKQTEVGTLYLDVVETGEEEENGHKTLKTLTSRRKVPVHPELLWLGFRDFAYDRQKHGPSAMLFTGLKPDKHGNYAKYACRRFRETFLPQQIQLEARQSFYSLRHNYRDALRKMNASEEALQVLGGWSQGKKTSDSYGDSSNPDFWISTQAKISFGLDLSHLHVQD